MKGCSPLREIRRKKPKSTTAISTDKCPMTSTAVSTHNKTTQNTEMFCSDLVILLRWCNCYLRLRLRSWMHICQHRKATPKLIGGRSYILFMHDAKQDRFKQRKQVNLRRELCCVTIAGQKHLKKISSKHDFPAREIF